MLATKSQKTPSPSKPRRHSTAHRSPLPTPFTGHRSSAIAGDETMDSSDSELFGTFSEEDIEVEDHDDSDGDSKDEENCLEEKRIAELSRDDIMQMEFADEDAVYRFYKTYAMVHGFAVRFAVR
ncbi:hypothetical protein PIB30_077990 [Stylosanthes scabra]|uniref:Uncharacterized protein n=1 Tax=Stylosanthes scabra TaxID=79078 RepID=A0ABU6QRW4_9FABA|nr:hypothetical protein [Stylosanthes scabra]